MANLEDNNAPKPLNFIQAFIEEDIKNEKHEGRVHTRFPPEAERIPAYRTCKGYLP